MQKPVKITGIGGSTDSNSYSLNVLKYAVKEISALGADTFIIDIKDIKLPIFRYSRGKYKIPEGIKKTLDIIHNSHGLILSSPEYHGTVSSAFKNVIDHLEGLSAYKPPYLTGKPVGCIAVGGGDNSGSFTLITMVNIVHSLRGIAASGSIAIPNIKRAFNNEHELTDKNYKRRLKRLASEVFFLASKLS